MTERGSETDSDRLRNEVERQVRDQLAPYESWMERINSTLESIQQWMERLTRVEEKQLSLSEKHSDTRRTLETERAERISEGVVIKERVHKLEGQTRMNTHGRGLWEAFGLVVMTNMITYLVMRFTGV